jgi:ComF family protein
MEVKMTSLIEKIVAIIAPHHCMVCGEQDNIVCAGCFTSTLLFLDPICVLCGKLSKDWLLCSGCQIGSGICHVWAGSEHTGVVEKVIHRFKFERTRAAYGVLTKLIDNVLPYDEWVIVPVPTVAAHVRQRGYDQTLLLARCLAAKRGFVLARSLERLHNARQVGANRVQRRAQSTKMFSVRPGADVRGAKILLVDDVCTTGATLSAAAKALRAAGAAQVDAVVAAWQPPKKK